MRLKRILIAFITLLFSIITHTSYANSDLDYGIYWFGKGNTSIKAVTGDTNPNFNKNKPTVIFVHGWHRYRCC